jgi:hypothetical protein
MLLKQHVDGLLAEVLRRCFQIHGQHAQLLPGFGREIDRQHALAFAAWGRLVAARVSSFLISASCGIDATGIGDANSDGFFIMQPLGICDSL